MIVRTAAGPVLGEWDFVMPCKEARSVNVPVIAPLEAVVQWHDNEPLKACSMEVRTFPIVNGEVVVPRGRDWPQVRGFVPL